MITKATRLHFPMENSSNDTTTTSHKNTACRWGDCDITMPGRTHSMFYQRDAKTLAAAHSTRDITPLTTTTTQRKQNSNHEINDDSNPKTFVRESPATRNKNIVSLCVRNNTMTKTMLSQQQRNKNNTITNIKALQARPHQKWQNFRRLGGKLQTQSLRSKSARGKRRLTG